MTLKRPFNYKTLEKEVINQLNQNEERLYSTKLESRYHTGGTATTTRVLLGQDMETGRAWFSANTSQCTSRTFAFAEKKGTIVYAQAHVMQAGLQAFVKDVTATSITITVCADQDISGNTSFSEVTTNSVSVFWQVVASNF